MSIFSFIYNIISDLIEMLDNTSFFGLGFSVFDFFLTFLVISTLLTLLINNVKNSQRME